MTDAESRRIKERMKEIRYYGRTEFSIEVLHSHSGAKICWMCATAWSVDGSLDGCAAEGASLKEALMNLADKITV